jgi:threonine synthase
MGNIAGGEIARQMGLPIRKFCAAVNANDITHRVMQTGRFHKSDAMIKTLSDAINIQIVSSSFNASSRKTTLSNDLMIRQPYNFERLLFYLTDGDHKLVHDWMTIVDRTAKLDLDNTWVEKLQLKFDSARVSDNEMCQIMKQVRDQFNYFADPHTSVALAAAKTLGYAIDDEKVDVPVAVLATASPCKFEESITVALGKNGWEDFKDRFYPVKAAEFMTKIEVIPFIYTSMDGEPLAKTQINWEAQARKLVDKLAG